MTPTTFTASEIVQALGIPHGTLNSWHHQGLLRNLDAARTIPGRARKYTRADSLALALIKIASDTGLGVLKFIANYAPIAARDYLADGNRVRILSVTYDIDAAGEPVTTVAYQEAPVSCLVSTQFNLGAIFDMAELNLFGVASDKS